MPLKYFVGSIVEVRETGERGSVIMCPREETKVKMDKYRICFPGDPIKHEDYPEQALRKVSSYKK